MIGALIIRQWRGLIPLGYSALGGAALTIGLSRLLSALLDYWLQLFSLHSVRAAAAFLAFRFLWAPHSCRMRALRFISIPILLSSLSPVSMLCVRDGVRNAKSKFMSPDMKKYIARRCRPMT